MLKFKTFEELLENEGYKNQVIKDIFVEMAWILSTMERIPSTMEYIVFAREDLETPRRGSSS